MYVVTSNSMFNEVMKFRTLRAALKWVRIALANDLTVTIVGPTQAARR